MSKKKRDDVPAEIPLPGQVPEVRPEELPEEPVIPSPRPGPGPAPRPEPGPMPEPDRPLPDRPSPDRPPPDEPTRPMSGGVWRGRFEAYTAIDPLREVIAENGRRPAR